MFPVRTLPRLNKYENHYLLTTALSLALLFRAALAAPMQTSAAKLDAEAAAAAQTFLASLDPTQRSNVVYDFKDDTQRKRWSNLPVSAVKRGGLRTGDLWKSSATRYRPSSRRL